MLLLRGDSLIGFAGSTLDAYPLMLQFRNWIETHPGARNRSLDINELKKRMRTVFNDMRLFIDDLPHGQSKPDPPDCELIFGGWSWQAGDFRAWRFQYVPSREILDFEPVGHGIKVGRDHPIVFAGTRAAVEKAREEIIRLLSNRGLFRQGIRYFDMEPFEEHMGVRLVLPIIRAGAPSSLCHSLVSLKETRHVRKYFRRHLSR
jgi:hypothetical protein